MTPKAKAPMEKTLSSKSKRVRGESSTAAAASSEGFDRNLFRSKGEYKSFVATTGKRKLEMMKTININFCREENFAFIDLLQNMGWLNICTLHEPHYPLLTQLFYHNLIPPSDADDFSFHTFVGGKEIFVTLDLLSSVTGCPNEGFNDFDGNYDREAATALLFGENHIIDEDFTSNQLSLQNRLLHWTINHVFNPRSGSYNLVNDYHRFFLYYIVRGIPVNLPHFIFLAMLGTSHNDRLLPYGGVITRILKQFEVNLSIDRAIPFTNYSILNRATLHRMHWIKDTESGEWVRRDGGDPPPPPPHPQPQAHPEEQTLEQRLFAQFDRIHDRFNSQDQQLSTISNTLEIQGTRISSLEFQFSNMVNLLHPPPPPQ